MDNSLQLKDIAQFWRRRKRIFIIVFSVVLAFFVGLAYILPPVYLSQATILVEGQQIPQDFVKSTVTSYVQERLQVINKQIMSRSRLQEIVDELNLYPELRDRYTTEEILAKMRSDITLEESGANVINERTGKEGFATITFTISYEGKNPAQVQKVTSQLASLYLEEDLKARERLTSNTTAFLEDELENLKNEIQAYETKIKEFKEANIGMLPGQNDANLNLYLRFERELSNIDARIQSLRERKIHLQGQMASVDPLLPIKTQDGTVAMNPRDRLKRYRLEYMSLRSNVSEKHPDLKRLKREIEELESQIGQTDDSVAKISRLSELQSRLATLSGSYGAKHPDVVKLKKEVELLSKEVDQLVTEKAITEVSEQKPDNPLYISLMTQLVITDSELNERLQEKNKIQQYLIDYQQRIEKAPMVEQAFNELTIDYQNARNKYNEISDKLMEARVAQGMEETQRGERFSIIESAQMPEKPYKPNRLGIILLGVVLASAFGLGFSTIQEYLDNSVKTSDELSALTGVPVFSVITLVETDEEKRARKLRKAALGAGIFCVILLVWWTIDYFIIPSEIVWLQIQKSFLM
jgi:polysaccharide biosynthesis transport protein